MVFKFTIVSDEIDEFVRVIEIDSEATFLELNNAILESVKYDNREMTTFFTCSDDWEKEQEITLIEMESSSEYDNLVMEETKLEELLDDEKQKLMFVFDMMSERAFFMELTEIITGKYLDSPVCTESVGEAPTQIENDFLITPTLPKSSKTAQPNADNDDEFYGEEYESDEFDKGGFSDIDFSSGDDIL